MMAKKIKKPVLGKDNSMVCNGRKYLVEVPEELGIDRKVEMTLEITRMINHAGENGVVQSFMEMRKSINAQDLTRTGYLLETQIMRVADINNRRDPMLWACTLFINTEDEDRTKIPTEAERQAKIADWNAEGVPYFFLKGCVEAFSDTLKKLCAAFTPTTLPTDEN